MAHRVEAELRELVYKSYYNENISVYSPSPDTNWPKLTFFFCLSEADLAWT
jgi:hypothetical protein